MKYVCYSLLTLILGLFSQLDAGVIRDALQEANEQVFARRGIQLKLLADCPKMVPILVQWQYDDWHSYDASLTKERLYNDFIKQLDQEGVPFTIVAFRKDTPIASISLDQDSEPELSDLQGPWPGSFHVIPEERSMGIGKALGVVLLTIAKRLGYHQLTFFTSNPLNVEKYVKKGASIIETRPFRGHTITVMKMQVAR